MNTPGLNNLVAGFEHEAFGSQAVFRTALEAMSHPGRPLDMPLQTALPPQGHAAAAALLLGLVDSETTLWLSPRLAGSDAATWLRFHTGCTWASDPAQAQFIWVALGDALPPLHQLRQGSDAYPDQSATCVIEVQNLQSLQGQVASWSLQGPGILGVCTLHVQGAASDFPAQWASNHASFPCGVDVFLASAAQIVGLPRTTRLTPAEEA
jgi:alpha-D-ribose 1-methylphosphonate 5-triphosphate synthase subunit PhnH